MGWSARRAVLVSLSLVTFLMVLHNSYNLDLPLQSRSFTPRDSALDLVIVTASTAPMGDPRVDFAKYRRDTKNGTNRADPTSRTRRVLSEPVSPRDPRRDVAHVVAGALDLFALALEKLAARADPARVRVLRFVYDAANPHVDSTCFHPVYGPRHAAWCKLLALHGAMKRYPRAAAYLWLDADAAFTSLDSAGFVRELEGADSTHGTGCYPPGCKSRECVDALKNASLVTASNWPACFEDSITAAMALRNTARGRFLLRTWWNVDACPQTFPWEQQVLNRVVAAAFPQDVSVLTILPNLHPHKREEAKSRIVHFGHTLSRRTRYWGAVETLYELGVQTQEEVSSLRESALKRQEFLTNETLNAWSRELAGEETTLTGELARLRDLSKTTNCFWYT